MQRASPTRVLETFGRCDILVNNAGMSPLYAKVTDITEEYYDKVSAVNLKGPFALSLRLGGHMFDHDGGVDPQHLDGRVDPARAATRSSTAWPSRGSTR